MTRLTVRTVAHLPPPALEDVRIRPYGITDGPRLRRMSERLSKASLYTRFFSGTPHIPDHYVRLLERLDHWDREALIALDADEIAGVAEYSRDRRRPWCADLAVLVTDPWQRRGVGSALVRYLAQLAARRGITEFEADVIPGNRDALRFVQHGWPTARARTVDGTAHFQLPLPVRP
ncbi:GNAT family N-acetyltransferase [Actinomadura terrae]|uniref:GNAT family N-acetyltransferase n=1 Tax=Actinomadura terrae TaxID=604353 RepID=UPI001FA733B1|nr:GNAT family N-acetyltransferase [Actinomadura terrae]